MGVDLNLKAPVKTKPLDSSAFPVVPVLMLSHSHPTEKILLILVYPSTVSLLPVPTAVLVAHLRWK